MLELENPYDLLDRLYDNLKRILKLIKRVENASPASRNRHEQMVWSDVVKQKHSKQESPDDSLHPTWADLVDYKFLVLFSNTFDLDHLLTTVLLVQQNPMSKRYPHKITIMRMRGRLGSLVDRLESIRELFDTADPKEEERCLTEPFTSFLTRDREDHIKVATQNLINSIHDAKIHCGSVRNLMPK